MYRHFLKAAAFAAAFFVSAPTFAADMVPPPRTLFAPVPYQAAPAFSWTRFYIGLNGSYGFASEYRTSFNGGGDALHSRQGGLFGVTLGADRQFGKWVVGIFGDADLAKGFEGDRSFSSCMPGSCSSSSEHQKLLGVATFQARVGHLFFGDRMLVYAMGGLATGMVEHRFDSWCTTCVRTQDIMKNAALGFTVGAGAEWMLTRQLSAKIDANWYDLNQGHETFKVSGVGNFQNNHDFRLWTVKAGLNYAF